jgi:hypothetical protein
MDYSKFYKSSSSGDWLMERFIAYTMLEPSQDVVHRFLSGISHDPEMQAHYQNVLNKSNLHQEMGRQARRTMKAEVIRSPDGKPQRVRVGRGGLITSYTSLRIARA